MWSAVFAATLVALVATPPVFPHAKLSSTTPANDAVLATSPARVTLRFDEPVETAFVSMRVYGGKAKRIDDGRTTRPSTKEVSVGIDRESPHGTYTVAWRAVSAHSHPVHGTFVFHVGEAGRRARRCHHRGAGGPGLQGRRSLVRRRSVPRPCPHPARGRGCGRPRRVGPTTDDVRRLGDDSGSSSPELPPCSCP